MEKEAEECQSDALQERFNMLLLTLRMKGDRESKNMDGFLEAGEGKELSLIASREEHNT